VTYNVAHVALAVPLKQKFRYRIPSDLQESLTIGQRVKINFSGRTTTAVVVFLSREDPLSEKLKPIIALEDPFPVFNQRRLLLARWIARQYMCTQGEVLKIMAPRLPKRRSKPRSAAACLEQCYPGVNDITLTDEQAHAVKSVAAHVSASRNRTVLLHGITGSGKTEVYIRVISRVLDMGKGAIVLEPEIALTPQTVERFKSRFGDTVAVLHSKQSGGERGREWLKIREGQARIVIGPRSAVFAPMEPLGLIVIDEEMETSYKQNETPRYHAREVALQRARQASAVVMIGSATPSLETYHKAATGQYDLLELPQRIGSRSLPKVEIVDMRSELLKNKNRTMFSWCMRERIQETLAQKGQVMLFVNRRGYFTFVQCRSCAEVILCRNCHISMKYHNSDSLLRCHYCDFTAPIPTRCPECGRRTIKFFGLGTEKVETEIKRCFPRARVARLDADSVSARHAHTRVLSAFQKGETDILVGTQMIAKGHDFPSVTMVGVVAADSTLNLPDFRSSERTFQLLTQVSGRAGRGPVPGQVVIQTYQPDHYAISCCLSHDYEAFYDRELGERKALGYPPFSRLLNIIVSGVSEQVVTRVAEALGQALRLYAGELRVTVLGPGRAPHERLRGKFRRQIILKGHSGALMRKLYRESLASLKGKHPLSRVRIMPDMDPYQLM